MNVRLILTLNSEKSCHTSCSTKKSSPWVAMDILMIHSTWNVVKCYDMIFLVNTFSCQLVVAAGFPAALGIIG